MSVIKELDEGSVIGNYRVVRCIGQGGMGTVYEVEHIELGVRYALKTFTFDSNDEHAETLKTKFLEEGKVLARLKHPNIAHVFDLAFDEESRTPYFVMDLVTYEDGESYTAEDVELSEVDEELAYQWFREVASALDYIHGEGIVHRDIKPGNLLLGKDLHVVLTDFGISRIFGKKLQGDVEAQKTMVTKTGRGRLVMGTEKYMAPEVAKGEEATPAADAYALGVMVLRWLTGFYYSDNPGCLALLAQKKYNWLPVIARLVAPATRRPDNLSMLAKQLKVKGVGEVEKRGGGEQRKDKSSKKKRKDTLLVLMAFVLTLLVVGGICAGAWAMLRYIKNLIEKSRNPPTTTDVVEVVTCPVTNTHVASTGRNPTPTDDPTEPGDPTESGDPTEPGDQTGDADGTTTPASPSEPTVPVVAQPGGSVTTVTDNVDYGPIPNKTYRWLVSGTPMRVNFQMANGAKVEMLPMKKGVFYMSNNWDDKKARHKVTLTRPFWVSKYCVTSEQWREFDTGYVTDCLPIEKALEGKYPVSKKVTRQQSDAFCKFLTLKYRRQIPEGYVFRLPSEAEWEYMFDFENTQLQYARCGGWFDQVRFNGKSSRETMQRILRQYKLETICPWETDNDCGWDAKHMIFVGGRLQPYSTGLYDASQSDSFVFDKMLCENTRHIYYCDEETNPLRWQNTQGTLCRFRLWVRGWWGDNGKHIHHLVLGPDLIKEKAWENPCRNVEHSAPVPNRHYAWDPEKVQKIIKKPKELTFKMAEGGDMIFCTIPTVKDFNMSNPDGQDKLYHKVTLTKPFWITKYCVTTKQWREYAKYDCEGVVRQVEKYFPKHPIYMAFTRAQWDGFCEYLNKRYGHQLPKGYVFRLPTEAEWEWAFVGDKNGDVRNMPANRFCNTDARFQAEFEKLLKKNKVPKTLPFDVKYGTIGDETWRAYVGGRVECTDTFGVCDMVAAGWIDSLVFDTYDSEDLPRDCCQYDESETDPVRWAGRLAAKVEYRTMKGGRGLPWVDARRGAHIVVGPDIETSLKKKELEPYPTEDFGGKLLSDVITNGGQSSKHPDKNRFNTPDKFKRMISTENTLLYLDEHKDADGFYTDKEDFPWIQLNLDKRRVITGLQIDALDRWAYNTSRHLRVRVSEDGKDWHREVAAENQRKHRYRFDLQGKNVTAKYIRIGREPGFMKDYFSLDKILVYGK